MTVKVTMSIGLKGIIILRELNYYGDVTLSSEEESQIELCTHTHTTTYLDSKGKTFFVSARER